jgi:hypothetical protein
MSVDRNDKRRSVPEEPTSVAFPRRRLGRVEHDERGNARMEWALLPESAGIADRVVLELLDDSSAGAPASQSPRPARGGFQPYGSGHVDPFGPAPRTEAPRKPKDLRKLGEWLKMTKELEERRKRGETD